MNIFLSKRLIKQLSHVRWPGGSQAFLHEINWLFTDHYSVLCGHVSHITPSYSCAWTHMEKIILLPSGWFSLTHTHTRIARLESFGCSLCSPCVQRARCAEWFCLHAVGSHSPLCEFNLTVLTAWSPDMTHQHNTASVHTHTRTQVTQDNVEVQFCTPLIHFHLRLIFH